MKNREELMAKNESYQKALKAEVDHAQDEVSKVVRNALIAGSLALAASLLQKAFFSDADEKTVFKPIQSQGAFLTDEVTERATIELLKLASNKLETFLQELPNED